MFKVDSQLINLVYSDDLQRERSAMELQCSREQLNSLFEKSLTNFLHFLSFFLCIKMYV